MLSKLDQTILGYQAFLDSNKNFLTSIGLYLDASQEYASTLNNIANELGSSVPQKSFMTQSHAEMFSQFLGFLKNQSFLATQSVQHHFSMATMLNGELVNQEKTIRRLKEEVACRIEDYKAAFKDRLALIERFSVQKKTAQITSLLLDDSEERAPERGRMKERDFYEEFTIWQEKTRKSLEEFLNRKYQMLIRDREAFRTQMEELVLQMSSSEEKSWARKSSVSELEYTYSNFMSSSSQFKAKTCENREAENVQGKENMAKEAKNKESESHQRIEQIRTALPKEKTNAFLSTSPGRLSEKSIEESSNEPYKTNRSHSRGFERIEKLTFEEKGTSPLKASQPSSEKRIQTDQQREFETEEMEVQFQKADAAQKEERDSFWDQAYALIDQENEESSKRLELKGKLSFERLSDVSESEFLTPKSSLSSKN